MSARNSTLVRTRFTASQKSQWAINRERSISGNWFRPRSRVVNSVVLSVEKCGDAVERVLTSATRCDV